MRQRHFLLVLGLLPVLAFAQAKVHIDFGTPGEYELWVSDKPVMAVSAMKVTDATVDIPIPAGEKKSRLFVWDRKSGNVASKLVGDLQADWKIKPEEFDTIGKVTVRVEHDGRPIAVAGVNAKSGADQRDSQLDASKKGEAVFFGLKPGTMDVTVRYNLKGQDAPPVKQSFSLDLKRNQPDPIFIVALTDDVETIGPSMGTAVPGPGANGPQGPANAGEKPKAEGGGGSIIGSIVIYLLVLGALGAVIYYGMRYIKTNQDKVGEQLKKMGVEIPDPQAQVDTGPAPVPVAPAPPQKIILDDADPNVPVATAPVASIAPISPVAVSQPSLVMENGDVFPIPDGETTVGREAGNGLSLIAESTVSRKHASVVRSGADVLLRDLGSSNGTFVNGVKIATDTPLRPGDQVQFGQVRFRYEA